MNHFQFNKSSAFRLVYKLYFHAFAPEFEVRDLVRDTRWF